MTFSAADFLEHLDDPAAGIAVGSVLLVPVKGLRLMSRAMNAKERHYPEVAAGGFTRVDGTIQFYTRVNALLEPHMIVLDFGAGRGAAAADDPVEYRRRLRNLKGRVQRVIGVDVDSVVHQNPTLDEAKVVRPGDPLPLPDSSIDMIISDSTFEHLESPALVAHEFARVTKPGGWVCVRTPNRWGYAALGARLVPKSLHNCLLRFLQPERKDIDVFPTYYRFNTKKTIHKSFPDKFWKCYIYTYNAEPAYFGNSTVAWWLMILILKFMPDFLGTTWMVFLQRTNDTDPSGGETNDERYDARPGLAAGTEPRQARRGGLTNLCCSVACVPTLRTRAQRLHARLSC